MQGCALLSCVLAAPTRGPGRGTELNQGIWNKEGWQEGRGGWGNSGSPPTSITLSLFHNLHTSSGGRQHPLTPERG